MSRSAFRASGMLHKVQVVTTVSTLASASGIASAEPSINSTDPLPLRSIRRAMAQEPRRGFEADHARHVARIERKVESGTDPDFEHSAFGCWDDTGAIGSEIFLPHRPVYQQGNDLILIEPHGVTRTRGLEPSVGTRRAAAGP
jgi:hypothetical protein